MQLFHLCRLLLVARQMLPQRYDSPYLLILDFRSHPFQTRHRAQCQPRRAALLNSKKSILSRTKRLSSSQPALFQKPRTLQMSRPQLKIKTQRWWLAPQKQLNLMIQERSKKHQVAIKNHWDPLEHNSRMSRNKYHSIIKTLLRMSNKKQSLQEVLSLEAIVGNHNLPLAKINNNHHSLSKTIIHRLPSNDKTSL
jgi:hypothetical protein